MDEAVLASLLAESMRCEPPPPVSCPWPTSVCARWSRPRWPSQRSSCPCLGERHARPGRRRAPAGRRRGAARLRAGDEASSSARRRRCACGRPSPAIYGVPLERRMQRLVARLSGRAVVDRARCRRRSAPCPTVVSAPGRRARLRRRAPRRAASRRRAPSRRAVAPSRPPWRRPPPSPDSAPSTPVVPERRPGLLQRDVPQSVRAGAATPRPGDVRGGQGRGRRGGPTATRCSTSSSTSLGSSSTTRRCSSSTATSPRGATPSGRARRARSVVGIGVPLDLPGLLAGARDKRASVVTKAPADGLDAVLLADLQPPARRGDGHRAARRAHARRGPARGRLRRGRRSTAASVQHVVAFAGVIGKAFERIIVRRKLDGFIAGQPRGGRGPDRIRRWSRPSPARSMPSIVPAHVGPAAGREHRLRAPHLRAAHPRGEDPRTAPPGRTVGQRRALRPHASRDRSRRAERPRPRPRPRLTIDEPD